MKKESVYHNIKVLLNEIQQINKLILSYHIGYGACTNINSLIFKKKKYINILNNIILTYNINNNGDFIDKKILFKYCNI